MNNPPIPNIYPVINPLPIRRPLPFLTAPRHSKHFLPNVLCRVNIKRVILVCISASIIFNLNNVNLQDFWINVISWDKVIECSPIVINHTMIRGGVSEGSRQKGVKHNHPRYRSSFYQPTFVFIPHHHVPSDVRPHVPLIYRSKR